MAKTLKQLKATRRWRSKNRKAIAAYNRERYVADPEKYCAMARARYHRDKPAAKATQKAWRKKNRVKRSGYMHRWAKNNRPRIAARIADRYANDPAYKVLCCLRANLACKLKRARAGKGSTKTIELLGCSIQSFMRYIESKFKGKISWANYGTYWHLDHIKPTSHFDLRDPEQRALAFHFSNYQPLRAILNLRKSNKVIEFPESAIAHPRRVKRAIARARLQFQT